MNIINKDDWSWNERAKELTINGSTVVIKFDFLIETGWSTPNCFSSVIDMLLILFVSQNGRSYHGEIHWMSIINHEIELKVKFWIYFSSYRTKESFISVSNAKMIFHFQQFGLECTWNVFDNQNDEKSEKIFRIKESFIIKSW